MTETLVDPDTSVSGAAPIPVRLIAAADWAAFAGGLDPASRAVAALADFTAQAGQLVVAPGPDGAPREALFGLGERPSPLAVRGLAARLSAGDYSLSFETGPGAAALAARAEDCVLAWGLGTYRFDRYKSRPADPPARLVVPAGVDANRVRTIVAACALARDMVNTPANDMGPADMEAAARALAQAHGAEITVTTGEALLAARYPAVHAVGRAADPARAPRMIEIAWTAPGAPADAPLVAVIGKGVVFDSGGLDIKPSAGMRLMKKDMGGGAHALALGRMIMELALPIRLAVLVPAVENAISGDAMRPGDVLASRSGLSIEVGNTDAEGRLILADALTRAGELEPDLTLDLATLTGAARVALGPQVIPFYTDDAPLAEALGAASRRVDDPLWRMPLWDGYAASIDSDIADLKNDPDAWAQAGSVTAALFLQRFAPKGPWAHFDIYAWNPRGRPGWPVGAEAQAIRAILAMLEDRYA
jgi:leucyl aminopeptidase